MSNINFLPTSFDGDGPRESGSLNGLMYLSVTADSAGAYGGSISGWVRPEVAKLVKAAPELLEALRAVAENTTSLEMRSQVYAAIDKATK